MTIRAGWCISLRRRHAALTALAASVLAAGTAIASAAPPPGRPLRVSARPADPAHTGAHVYERTEFAITLTGGAQPYANPFDPDEIAVDGVLNGPGGRRMKVPAFLYQPCLRRQAPDGRVDMAPVPGSAPAWRLRVAPQAAGRWSLVVHARDRFGGAASAPITFKVDPPGRDSHGFVRRAAGAGKSRYFALSDGSPYFIVGENVGWARWEKGLTDYDLWFGALGRAGANFARVWQAMRAIETKETGAGRYDLAAAAYMDEVLATAQSAGLRCMLALGTYGELNTGGYFNEGQWAANPYNAANGGPVPSSAPDDFFTSPAARKLYRNRLRYLVARYSAFTGLGFWEFFNERAAPPGWLKEMAGYLKGTDPYRRPVTNSYTTVGPSEAWTVPDLDLTQTHRYGDEGSIRDIATGMPGDARAHDRYAKPHLMGEYGISWRRSDAEFDPNGAATNLHNGLWSGAMSGDAGGAVIWWWDTYIHPKNLYGGFTALSAFAKGTDWPNRAFEPLEVPAPTMPQTGPESFSDIRLSPDSGWGAVSAGPVTVGRDGEARGPGSLLTFLYGPDKPDLSGPQKIQVTMPRAGAMRVGISNVSSRCVLRVQVDGRPAASWVLDPTPGGPRGYKETQQHPEFGGIYQARFDVTREVPLPAGDHLVALDVTEGDWVQVSGYELQGAQSSRFAALRPLALQDRRSSETLVWLQDPESTWAADQAGRKPRRWEGAALKLPLPRPGRYRVEWWDTRAGKRISTLTAAAGGSRTAPVLELTAPAFTRDIALRVTASAAGKARP